ncbi:hypothetical protein E4U42_005904 [Claviceps africana]|uniref:Mannosyltransferase n=1 Tax=Claviceps africana TaxID=83212 RepID=A0A8K0JE38_9HYPO|nr:hypothetical protein E4U42_005904 [Claviceps africana]
MALIDALLTSTLYLVPLLHILVSPHTKVEESFNLQAAHDILVYGTPTSDVRTRFLQTYDHFSFPGAVPRTFVGAVLLAGVSQPVVSLLGFARAQLVVRAVLALFNASCLVVFRNAVRGAFGRAAARWWTVLLVSQFHVVYYLGRTLPNMFAFGLTTLALALLLPRAQGRPTVARQKQALSILTFSGVVFRSELAILLATTSLYLLLTRHMSPRDLVVVGLASLAASLAVSVPIDSYFWQKPVWPELWGFHFNAVRGQSSSWGTSPWHYYFTSALPRLLLNPLALPLVATSLLHPSLAPRARALLAPCLGFVAVYSLQPHKETRFVFYAVPSLTLAAALAASFICGRAAKSPLYSLLSAAVLLSVPATLSASTAMLLLSSLNYPGGHALAELYAHVGNYTAGPVTAHADVPTCMTGLTLFNQNKQGLPLALIDFSRPDGNTASLHAPVYLVDKTEHSEQLGWPSFWQKFDYALLEDPALAIGEWDVVGAVHGYSGIEVLRPGQHPDPGADKRHALLGPGAWIPALRDHVRAVTGGWWVGPKMSPRVHVMKRRSLV